MESATLRHMRHEGESRPELDPELLRAYATTFISRWDTYPIQNPKDGTYFRAKDFTTDTILPLTPAIVERHLRGDGITIGAYLLDTDSQAKSLVFDADDADHWASVQHMADQLEQEGVPSYREQSRRGGHLWLFFDRMPGADARRFGIYLRSRHELDGIELYPKQDRLTEMNSVGSLVRLPLGLHRHPDLPTPQRFVFVTHENTLLAPTVREQMAILANPQKVPKRFIKAILKRAPETELHFPTPHFDKKTLSKDMPPDKKIKASVSVHDFISQFVELSPTGRGYCPFHEDHRMSFSAPPNANYWHCFAGCTGQTVIDFYIRWKGYQSLDLDREQWGDILKEMLGILHL